MRKTVLLALSLGGCATQAAAPCTLDGRAADSCVVERSNGFVVAAYRGHEDLELDAPDGSMSPIALPGNSMLEYTDAAGTTCDAVDGSATWGDEGDEWCMRTQSTCGGYHTICMPLAQFYK